MDVTVLLADASEANPQTGKVSALGVGWSVTSTPLGPFSVIVLLDVAWDETNRQHMVVIQLVDADGRQVTAETPTGEQPVRVEAQFESGRPPGLLAGTPISSPFVFSHGPGLQLAPGRYEWRVEINGETKAGWRRGFTVTAGPPPQG